MNQNAFEPSCSRWLLVVVSTGLAGVPCLSHAAESAPASTNNQPAALEVLDFDLQMRRGELEHQGFKVSRVRKDGYPAFSIGPYYFQERAGDREQQVGVGISLPLPLWNRNRGNVEVAEARQLQAETSLYVTQRDLDRRIVQTATLAKSPNP